MAAELSAISERLADLAYAALRAAADPDDPDHDRAAVLEKQLARARRSTIKAASMLGGVVFDD